MIRLKPCGACVRAEFADEESEGLAYMAAPGSRTAHAPRPSGSEGSGDAYQALAWAARGEKAFTYCGRPIGPDWIATPDLVRRDDVEEILARHKPSKSYYTADGRAAFGQAAVDAAAAGRSVDVCSCEQGSGCDVLKLRLLGRIR